MSHDGCFQAKINDKLLSLFSRIEPSAPGRVKVTDVESRSVTLCWERPVSMEGVSYDIHITYGCEGQQPRSHSDQQEGPEHPVNESHAHSDNHAHTKSHGPPEVEDEETTREKNEKDEAQTSCLESVNQQRDATPAEHITSDTPAPEYQEENTDNRSSLDPEPAPENTSSCLAQSQPSSADPAKSDAKTGLVDSDNMDGTLSKDSKDTVCTAQEEEVRALSQTSEQ
ncbi:hypothetical protein SKAU_G00378960 [Synaphobranchus kaupii]|uniref:Uncharacterized protein n=1 Tax=Synaphobranchus kaupii TaxID=118154 RepID=A0A9Q1IEH8_SYNKA|nr:hypothetical protein SKAU_G00378960 [Synaphobranchus kaupii]